MSLAGLLNQSVTIATASGRDKYGKPALAAGTSVSARFEKTARTITTTDRDREPIDGVVFVGPAVTVEIGDQLTYDGQAYRVMRASPIVDGAGTVRHKELLVQLWSVS